jgi:c-di-GMP-binding flagellar brake protein YcgR
MAETNNKRDNERVAVPSPLYGEVQVYQPMTILDISRGGAQIETPFALQLDSLHDFRISLGDRSVVVKGRIAHCHIGELTEGVVLYRTGVEFIEISEHVAAAVQSFVAALKASHRAPEIMDGEIADDGG